MDKANIKSIIPILLLAFALVLIPTVSAFFEFESSAALTDFANLTYTADTTPTFNMTVIGNATAYQCTLSVDGTAKAVTYGVLNNTANWDLTTTLSSSATAQQWNVSCSANGETNSSTLMDLFVIGTAPAVNSANQEDGSYSTALSTDLNINVSSLAPDTCSIQVINTTGGINTTIAPDTAIVNGGTTNFADYVAEVDGAYKYTVTCNDSVGTSAVVLSNYTVNVDSTYPTAPIIVSPKNHTIISDNTPLVTYSVSTETNFARYRLEFSTSISFATIAKQVNETTKATTSIESLTLADDTQYYMRVCADDTAGNSNCSSETSLNGSMEYKVDGTFRNLRAGWNLFGSPYNAATNTSTFASSIGSQATTVMKVNATDGSYISYVVGSVTNADTQFDRGDVVFVYVSAATTWDGYDATDQNATKLGYNFTNHTGATGAYGFLSIMTLAGDIDFADVEDAMDDTGAIGADGTCNGTIRFMTYFNNSGVAGASGIGANVYNPRNWKWEYNGDNATTMDFGEVMIGWYNGTTAGEFNSTYRV